MRSSLASLSGWGLLASAFLLNGGNAQSDDGPHDVPPTDDFLRRMGGRSVVIGNYIYFDGGELSERGFAVSGGLTNPANATLSIDLSKSWSPSDVQINEISRPDDNPAMTRQHILKDASEDTFYIWGGGVMGSRELQTPPVLWKFQADGKGGGAWLEETNITNRGRFEDFDRTLGGAYASTPGKGLIFGGHASGEATPNPKDRVSGYLSFDFDDKEWTRDARGPYTDSGALTGATATFVPDFGPNGLVVILGGVSANRAEDYLDFGLIHFMDPVTNQWFTQVARGDAPDERATHCAVGVSGHNGTYEIFVYGGEIRYSFETKRDMYALSLPGFQWTKVPDNDATERRDHVCDVVGKRQMLSWGGLNSSRNGHEGHWLPKDPFPNGIGIFDLSELEWKDSYDADAAEYQTHESIMSWYSDGGLSRVDWGTGVEALFASQNSGAPGDDDDDDSGNGGGNGDGNGGGGNDNNSDEGSSVSGGTIAGAVVGGIGGLALIGGLAWFFLRRRKAETPETTTASAAEPYLAEADNTPKPYSGSPAYTESYAQSSPYAPGTYAPVPQQTPELMANNPPVEMADTSRERYN